MGQASEHPRQKPIESDAGSIGKTARNLMASTACTLICGFLSLSVNGDEVLLNETDSPPFIHTFQQARFENGAELIISGNNESSEQQILIVRLDNESSSDYRSRFNQEFTLPPGPFERVLPLSGLKTSGGQPLQQPYSKLFVFTADTWADTTLNQVLISSSAKLPENTLALDFGANKSAAFPGFEAIDKSSPYLKGKIAGRVRTSGDALVRDGLVGVTNLEIPWPDGQWKLSLWTQDQGEWEYFPHFLSRQIIANGTVIIDQQFTRKQWINDVYLAGRKKEGAIDGDLWSLVGQRRSGFISKNIRVTNGMVNIDLTGDYNARYLSALVLEPTDGNFAKTTREKRRERFLNQWPVTTEPYRLPESLSLTDISQQVKEDGAYYSAARDSILNLTFEIASPVDDMAPVLVISPPKSANGQSLQVIPRYGHWRYERPEPNATSLILDDSYLRADMENMRLSSQRPRRLYVQVKVPADTLPGDYAGKVQLFSHGKLRLLDYRVRVLPVILPELTRSVGLYLEPPPYYQWFKSMAELASNATSCDLSLLAAHGFSTVAPALTTPDTEASRKAFIQQIRQIKRFGFDNKILAYSPLKRLLKNKGDDRAADDVMALEQQLQDQNLPDIYWSMFDEPAKDHFAQIINTADLLKERSASFKTAGHMNDENQTELTRVTDLLLINHGADVTEESIHQWQENGSVWLYNMPKPTIAAGLFLWRSGAGGYLQWHGRMPTADPFDPTDGREGDVIYLYPSASHCAATPDIHRRFLDLHEATLDLRWLQWLENLSSERPEAKQILANLRAEIPSQWERAAVITERKRLEIRKKIMSTMDGY